MDRDRNELFEFTVVDYRNTAGEDPGYLRWQAECLAVEAGIAKDLTECPNGHGLQGVGWTVDTPGTPADFNAGAAVQLRCGCWLV